MIPETMLLPILLLLPCPTTMTLGAPPASDPNEVVLVNYVRSLSPGPTLPQYGPEGWQFAETLLANAHSITALAPPDGWCAWVIECSVACAGSAPTADWAGQDDTLFCSGQPVPSEVYQAAIERAEILQGAGSIGSYLVFHNILAVSGTYALPIDLPGTFAGGDPYRFCEALPNSVGAGALIDSLGTPCQSANDLVLLASPVPDQLGLFFLASELLPQAQPFGEGLRCASGQVVRLSIEQAVGGVLAHDIDLAALHIGSTWYVQAWYRDPAGGGAGFNLSDGLSLYVFP